MSGGGLSGHRYNVTTTVESSRPTQVAARQSTGLLDSRAGRQHVDWRIDRRRRPSLNDPKDNTRSISLKFSTARNIFLHTEKFFRVASLFDIPNFDNL